jgi:myosin-1
VRTIKPNETKQPQDWDASRVRHQVQYLGLLENVRVRRAGFCFRAPYERFLARYKKLNEQTWGTWGEWTGNKEEGTRIILGGTPLDQKQFQFGKTKIFIRHPESLFYLEESLERHDYECASIIQKAYRKYMAKKKALEQRRQAANLFKGKKERRRDSVAVKFDCDYMNFDKNYQLQECLGQGREERVIFADQIVKFNRRLRPERRDLVITVEAFYICMRCKKNNQDYYKLTKRADLRDIQSITLSTLQDNFMVFKTNNEDILIENSRKN